MSELVDRAAANGTAATGLRPLLRRHWLIGITFACLAMVPLADHVFGMTLTPVTKMIMIMAIAALSLDLILGYGAMVSLGHAAFIGIGAYAVGISAAHGLYESSLTVPIAIAACALFALVTGAISIKTRGVYFIMITLAFGQMTYYSATSLSAYGGDDGLTVWGNYEILGTAFKSSHPAFFYAVFVILVGAYVLLRLIVGSRFGRVLKGCKQSPVRMQAIGISPYMYQLTAYVIAGSIAGVAGALYALNYEFVSPSYMSWHHSGELIVMVVLGGAGTLTGPVLGAIAYLGLREILLDFTQHWHIIFGPLLILLVLFARGGIAKFIDREKP